MVESLLMIVEQLAAQVGQQNEEIQLLKDEIRVLKGEKKRPVFKPSRLDKDTENANKDDAEGNQDKPRAGSTKRAKTAALTVHEDKVIAPHGELPPGSRFKGYRDFVVQELMIRPHTIRYRLARWRTPQGQTLIGQLPSELNGHHFGPNLVG